MTDQNNQTQTVNVDRENQCENTQPNEQCPICQEQITQNNASFVDLCLHQYCFECLKKWCEVKAECPLCKQKIEKIIHSVTSPQTYKEFYPTTRSILQQQASFEFLEDSDNEVDDDDVLNITNWFHHPGIADRIIRDTDDEGDDTDESLAINSTHSGGSPFVSSPIRFVHSSPITSPDEPSTPITSPDEPSSPITSPDEPSSPISNASTEIIMPVSDSSQSPPASPASMQSSIHGWSSPPRFISSPSSMESMSPETISISDTSSPSSE